MIRTWVPWSVNGTLAGPSRGPLTADPCRGNCSLEPLSSSSPVGCEHCRGLYSVGRKKKKPWVPTPGVLHTRCVILTRCTASLSVNVSMINDGLFIQQMLTARYMPGTVFPLGTHNEHRSSLPLVSSCPQRGDMCDPESRHVL